MCAKQVKKSKKTSKSKPKKAKAKKTTTKKVVAKKTSVNKSAKKSPSKKTTGSKTKSAKKKTNSKTKPVAKKSSKVASKKASTKKTTSKKATKATTKKKAAVKNEVKKAVKKSTKTATPKPAAKSKPAVKKPRKSKKTRYTERELEFFKRLIDKKLLEAQGQLEFYLAQIKNIGNNADSKLKGLDDGTSTRETEQMYSLAARQRKYIQHLENAKLRIKNNIYGVCRVTGNLISKERLKAVPHATLSIGAKLKS